MAAIQTLLTGLARERASGSISLAGTGKAYLDGGRVTFLESDGTPSLEDMLTARGRTIDGLTRAELQFCVVGTVLDAAGFLLSAELSARPRFRPGERHPYGEVWAFEVAWLIRECARRRSELAQTWPSTELDGVPVTPAHRPPGQRVTVGELEWEILIHADGVATPADLAVRLGQPVYTVLLTVRRMAALGLLTRPEPASGPQPPPEEPHRSKKTAASRMPDVAETVDGADVSDVAEVVGEADISDVVEMVDVVEVADASAAGATALAGLGEEAPADLASRTGGRETAPSEAAARADAGGAATAGRGRPPYGELPRRGRSARREGPHVPRANPMRDPEVLAAVKQGLERLR
ncbi:hypothetical protein [Nonomuraea longicatena]|uniref:DUF4388 domain-containing protein n=1 Tax=Nonomuraea longicatena TaxID=83682 RepID=A0ABN1NSH0_9ACTN